MNLCLTTVVGLAVFAAQGAAEQYLPGPAPTVGALKHLTEAEAAIGSPRDRLEFGIGERVTFWIDRATWNDVDLMRPTEDARWREVPDEMGIVIWSVDGSSDVFPTVADETTLTVSMSGGQLRIAAAVTDSGQRGKDKKTAAPIGLAGNLPGRSHLGSRQIGAGMLAAEGKTPLAIVGRRSVFGGLLGLAGVYCLLEAEAAPAAKTLAQLLVDLEDNLKRGRETNLDQVERGGRELLAHRDNDPESQGLIYHRMAKIAAESGQIAPNTTIAFAEAALKRPLPPDLRVHARVYWGDALQVLDYGDFPQRRPAAADVYLKALADVLEFKPLPVKKELLPKNKVVSGDGENPDDPGGVKAFNASMANWEAQRLNESMQRNRRVVIGQLVSLYARQPDAAAELEARAKVAIADPEVVRELMGELEKARARRNPVDAAKRSD
ncbi:MAG TPA: hypothetical protein VGG30_03335 [Pirellulales bacterium]